MILLVLTDIRPIMRNHMLDRDVSYDLINVITRIEAHVCIDIGLQEDEGNLSASFECVTADY